MVFKSINEFVFVSRTLQDTRLHSSRVKDAMINIKDPGLKKPFQFTILSKTPTCKTAVSTSADLDIAVVEHPHLLISPSASG